MMMAFYSDIFTTGEQQQSDGRPGSGVRENAPAKIEEQDMEMMIETAAEPPEVLICPKQYNYSGQ